MAILEIKMEIARNGWMNYNTFESLLLENVFRNGWNKSVPSCLPISHKAALCRNLSKVYLLLQMKVM